MVFIRGNENPVSYELQMLFDYGISQEILGTLLGKILPVYFLQLLFKEDGCEVIPIGYDSKAAISGDRTGVDKQDLQSGIRVQMSVSWKEVCYWCTLQSSDLIHDTGFKSDGSKGMLRSCIH